MEFRVVFTLAISLGDVDLFFYDSFCLGAPGGAVG
jgi:hypothetical protein